MKTILADYKYSEPNSSAWAAAISRWRDGNFMVTTETEFTQVRGALQLSRTDKHLIFIHGDPQFGDWETALNSRELDAIVIRVSTEGHPPRPSEAPSIHLCSYTPEEFSSSARVAKFFAALDGSPSQAIDLLLRTECSRIKALAIFLDCLAVAQETLVDNGIPNRLDVVTLLGDPRGSTTFTALTREITVLLSGCDVPEFSEFLQRLSSVVSNHRCDDGPIYASGFLTSIGLDARAACNMLTSILNKTP